MKATVQLVLMLRYSYKVYLIGLRLCHGQPESSRHAFVRDPKVPVMSSKCTSILLKAVVLLPVVSQVLQEKIAVWVLLCSFPPGFFSDHLLSCALQYLTVNLPEEAFRLYILP